MKEILAEIGNFNIEARIVCKMRFADDTAIRAKTQEELADMEKTGKKLGMDINIEKSQIMRVARR